MKLIIAGTRTLNFGAANIRKVIDQQLIPPPTEIVSGCASGIDSDGISFGIVNNLKITRFKPDWDTYGKAAGPIRNRQMAEYADALLLIWDGKSRGSMSMKQEMTTLGKPIFEVILPYGPRDE